MNDILGITGSEHIFGEASRVFEFDGFEFSEKDFIMNPILMLGTVLAADPTPGQKRMLDLSGIVMVDKNGKQFFPREEKEEE